MSNTKVHEFKVTMTCEGCSGAVSRVLGKMKGKHKLVCEDKGVEDVDISLKDQKVKVKTSLSADDILEVIKKTGKEVEYVSSN